MHLSENKQTTKKNNNNKSNGMYKHGMVKVISKDDYHQPLLSCKGVTSARLPLKLVCPYDLL